MENWKECEKLERDIILSIQRKSLTITEISKKIKRAKPTISESIKRLSEQEIVTKIHDYKEDARKSKILINPKRIRIEKSHTFYLIYYVLIFISMISSGIISKIIKNFFLVLGSVIVALPILLMMFYQVYGREDKTIVYKNPKTTKKKEKQEVQKEPENLLGSTN